MEGYLQTAALLKSLFVISLFFVDYFRDAFFLFYTTQYIINSKYAVATVLGQNRPVNLDVRSTRLLSRNRDFTLQSEGTGYIYASVSVVSSAACRDAVKTNPSANSGTATHDLK